MRRTAVVLGLCALLLPTAAWADGLDLINEFGTATITSAGISTIGSELKGFSGVTAPPGRSLGSVSFSTGALTSGSIWGGGTFSSTGSTFDVIGRGLWAKQFPGFSHGSVALFTASFVGPIKWILVSHTGKYNYVFTLKGAVQGQLWNGRSVTGTTAQTISVNQNQWFQDQRGHIDLGRTGFQVGPEPGTLGMFCAGLIVLAGAMRRKLFGA